MTIASRSISAPMTSPEPDGPYEPQPDFHQKLLRLRDLWATRRQGESLPLRASFSPRDLKPWLANIALLDLKARRFRVRLMGTSFVSILGADLTGRWLDEWPGSHPHPEAGVLLRDCLDTGAPVFAHAACAREAGASIVSHWLFLPCASVAHAADTVLAALYARRIFAIACGPGRIMRLPAP